MRSIRIVWGKVCTFFISPLLPTALPFLYCMHSYTPINAVACAMMRLITRVLLQLFFSLIPFTSSLSTPLHFNLIHSSVPFPPSSLPFYHLLVHHHSPFFHCHSGLVEQPSELEVVEMLQLIDWLEYFQEQMRVFGYDESSLKCMARFPVIAEDLLR